MQFATRCGSGVVATVCFILCIIHNVSTVVSFEPPGLNILYEFVSECLVLTISAACSAMAYTVADEKNKDQ